MYPSFHNDVLELLQEHDLQFSFNSNDYDADYSRDYDTNIMGRFECPNEACSANGWTSKQIAITIRMYPDRRYNARVYHQACERCKRLSKPVLDTSYADRVAYRLKKWCGVDMEPPPFSGRSEGPHRKDLCEGCKEGHCSNARSYL